MVFFFKKRKLRLIFKQYNWLNSKTITLCSIHRFVLLVCLRFCVTGLAMNEICNFMLNCELFCSFSSLSVALSELHVCKCSNKIDLWYICKILRQYYNIYCCKSAKPLRHLDLHILCVFHIKKTLQEQACCMSTTFHVSCKDS